MVRAEPRFTEWQIHYLLETLPVTPADPRQHPPEPRGNLASARALKPNAFWRQYDLLSAPRVFTSGILCEDTYEISSNIERPGLSIFIVLRLQPTGGLCEIVTAVHESIEELTVIRRLDPLPGTGIVNDHADVVAVRSL